MSKKIFPIGHPEKTESGKLHRAISQKLMDFVVHNQTPYSKTLQKFIATGCHDLRAGNVAIDILQEVQNFLNKDE